MDEGTSADLGRVRARSRFLRARRRSALPVLRRSDRRVVVVVVMMMMMAEAELR